MFPSSGMSNKPPRPPKQFGGGNPGMAPPKPPEADMKDPNEEGGKVSREKALFVEETHHCKDCSNYSSEDGSCSKVEGQMDPEDACLRHFKAGGEGSADEEAGESPEMEATENEPAE